MKSATKKMFYLLPLLLLYLLCLLVITTTPLSIEAYEVDSTNYKLTGVTTSGLGGIFESTNYSLISNTGQISADPRNYSTSYRINQGPSEAFRAAQVSIQCFETDTTIPPGIIGLYNMNEGSNGTCSGGEDVCDRSGLNNDLTSLNTSIIEGYFDKGRSFDGAGSYLSIPSMDTSSTTSSLTISFWSNTDSETFIQSFISDQAQSHDVGYIWLYRSTNAITLQYATEIGQNRATATWSGYFDDNVWLHTAIVIDYANNTAKLYKNGQPFGTTHNSSFDMQFPTTPRRKNIGVYSTSGSHPLKGEIDEFVIYNEALTDQEILERYNNQIPTNCLTGPTELSENGMLELCGGTGCYDKARFEIDPHQNPEDTLYTIQISTDNFVSDVKCVNASTFIPQSLTNCDINDFRSKEYWEDEIFNIQGLEPNTTYYLRISGLHGDFTQSDYSKVKNATTSEPYIFFDIDIATDEGGMTTVPVTSNRVLHFDATTISGLSENDPVATWDDLSSSGNDASQGTSSRRPLYKESSFNGNPAVEFNPTNLTSLAATSPTSLDNDYTAFAAVYPYTQTGSGDFSTYGFSIMATTTRYALWLLLNQGEIKHYAHTGSTATYGLTSGANVPNTNGSIITVDSTINTPNGANIYLNSNLETTHTPANSPWEGGFCIGDLRNGRNIGFNGLIGEILVYDSILSEQQRSLIEQYLGEKWLGWTPTSGNYAESSPPYSVSFSGDARLIAGAGAVTAPTLIWMDLESSSTGGVAIIQRGEHGGLYSPTTTETITSSNLDLDGVLAEGFGLQNYYIDYDTSTYLGIITATTNYSGSGNVVGEVLTDARKVYDASGPINAGRMGLYLKARAAESRTPATDYSEFITFVSVPRY